MARYGADAGEQWIDCQHGRTDGEKGTDVGNAGNAGTASKGRTQEGEKIGCT